MFWGIYFLLAVLLFVWRMRTDSQASIIAKLIVSAIGSLVGTVALYAVYYFFKFLFIPALVLLGLYVLYLVFFAKTKAAK